jgi:hypothetical protein
MTFAIVNCVEDCVGLDAAHYQSTKTVLRYQRVPSGTVQFAGIVSAHISMTFTIEHHVVVRRLTNNEMHEGCNK